MRDIIDDITVLDKKTDPMVIKAYLEDEFFEGIGEYLKKEDYALAKDATKGLYILASELALFGLYDRLLDLYVDLEYEEYNHVLEHYEAMYQEYKRLKEAYHD